MRHRIPADVLLLVTVAIWSFNFTAVKYAVTNGLQPLAYSSIRFALAALLFSGLTYARERSLRMDRRAVWVLSTAALVGIAGNQLCFVYALRLTNAATVALQFGTLPILVALFAWLSGVERLDARHWIATGFSFGGVALVALGAETGLSGDVGGILLGLGAAATWALYTVAIAPLMSRYSPYRVSAIGLAVGALPLLVAGAAQIARQDWSAVTGLVLAAFLYSLICSLVLTNVLYFTALERVGAGRASLYANLQPFLGAFFALVVLSEEMTLLQVAGGLVIGAGIVLARRRTAPAASPE